MTEISPVQKLFTWTIVILLLVTAVAIFLKKDDTAKVYYIDNTPTPVPSPTPTMIVYPNNGKE